MTRTVRNRLQFGLAMAGAVVAGLLTYWHFMNIDMPCTNSGCAQVAASEYSRFLRVPVAAWGLAYYLAILVISASIPSLPESKQRVIDRLSGLLHAGAFVASAVLTALEAWVIRAFCQYCIASAIIVVLLCINAWWPGRPTSREVLEAS